MPFTLAHAAAALPFRRCRVVLSALVIGTLSPDFEYFLRMDVEGRIGHSVRTAFLFSLPVALVVLWLYQRFVKAPVILLLPAVVQRRLAQGPEPFRFSGLARLLWIALSALLGIATHLLWDSFTHYRTWPYRHFSVLRMTIHLPIVRPMPVYRICQYGSSLFGCCVLLVWFWLWYNSTEPRHPLPHPAWSSRRKLCTVSTIAAVALLGTCLRVYCNVGFPRPAVGKVMFAVEVIVTFIAMVWWELVAYGIWLRSKESLR